LLIDLYLIDFSSMISNNIHTCILTLLSFSLIQAQPIEFPLRHRGSPSRYGAVAIQNLETVYMAELLVGTPPQIINITVDTGSSDTWVVAASDPYCGDPASENCAWGIYNQSQSSTYEVLNHNFNITYADHSGAYGVYASESVTLGDFHLSNYTLGVAFNSTMVYGYLGLGMESIEATELFVTPPYEYTNFLPALKDQGYIDRRAFSLYLNGPDDDCGNILFGAVDHAKYEGPLFTLPIVNNQPTEFAVAREYTVQLNEISLSNGDVLQSVAQPFLLDSGYTLTALWEDVFIFAINELFQASYNEKFGYYVRDCNFHSDLSLVFTFPGGYTIEVPLTDFVLPLEGDICLVALMPTLDAGESVAGDPVLRRMYAVYDQESWTISLGQAKLNESDCSISILPSLNSSVPPATAPVTPLSRTLSAIVTPAGSTTVASITTATSSSGNSCPA
jgi:yapsin 1/2